MGRRRRVPARLRGPRRCLARGQVLRFVYDVVAVVTPRQLKALMAMLSRGGSQRTVLDLLWDLPPGTVIEGEFRRLGSRVSVSRLDRLEWRSRSGFSRLEYVALTGRAGLLRGTVSEYTLLTLLRVVPEHRVWWSGPKVVRVSAEPPVSAR